MLSIVVYNKNYMYYEFNTNFHIFNKYFYDFKYPQNWIDKFKPRILDKRFINTHFYYQFLLYNILYGNEMNVDIIKYIDEEYHTSELYKLIIARNIYSITHFKLKNLTKEIINFTILSLEEKKNNYVSYNVLLVNQLKKYNNKVSKAIKKEYKSHTLGWFFENKL
jgi:hypothetical protein